MYRINSKSLKRVITNFLLVLTAVIFFSASPAGATEDDGNALLKRCGVIVEMAKGGMIDPSQTNNLMYCMGYFTGVIGTYNNTVVQDNYKITPYCLPMGATWKPVAEQVGLFMLKHPELLHQPAEAIITMALTEAYPCGIQ